MSAQKTSDPAGRPSTDQLKGSVKEAIGKLIGDGKVEAEGKAQELKAQELKGEARKTVGGAKDGVDAVVDKVTGKR